MTPVVWAVGIILLGQLVGCAGLRWSTGSPDEQFAYWLDRQEYGKASALVAELKAAPSPDIRTLEEWQAKLTVQVATYERQVIAAADAAADGNDWGTAFDGYRTALSRVPGSSALRRGHQRLLQRHAEYLDRVELERLIAKGEWTLKDLEVTRLAEAADSDDWFGGFVLRRKTAAAEALSAELADRGERALGRGDLASARRLSGLAAKLPQAVEGRDSLARLQAALLEKEAPAREQRARTVSVPVAPPPVPLVPHDADRALITPQKHDVEPPLAVPATPPDPRNDAEPAATARQEQKRAKQQLMADFKKACREKDLTEAQRLQSQLEALQVDDREFDQLSAQLSTDIAKHVKHLIAVGAAHYTQQQYEDARQVWKEAHALDPKNEQLNTRLKRVTRVLDKLQRLREKNAAAP